MKDAISLNTGMYMLYNKDRYLLIDRETPEGKKIATAIVRAIETKKNEGKIYEIGGPKVISFGDMVKSILKTINKKRFVVPMPMPIAKIQSTITDLLPFPPILTKDQCEILSEADNVVSDKNLTLKDLDIEPSDVEEEMKKWLWRYKDGGQFAKT